MNPGEKSGQNEEGRMQNCHMQPSNFLSLCISYAKGDYTQRQRVDSQDLQSKIWNMYLLRFPTASGSV